MINYRIGRSKPTKSYKVITIMYVLKVLNLRSMLVTDYNKFLIICQMSSRVRIFFLYKSPWNINY